MQKGVDTSRGRRAPITYPERPSHGFADGADSRRRNLIAFEHGNTEGAMTARIEAQIDSVVAVHCGRVSEAPRPRHTLERLFKPRRISPELELPGIIPHHPDISLIKPLGRICLDLQRHRKLGPPGPLQFHHNGSQNRIKCLHRPDQVDLDGSIEPPRLRGSLRCQSARKRDPGSASKGDPLEASCAGSP